MSPARVRQVQERTADRRPAWTVATPSCTTRSAARHGTICRSVEFWPGGLTGWSKADAVLVVDNTGVPKKGTLSVGVVPRYCGELGNRPTADRWSRSRWRATSLFLPKTSTDDPARCAAAGVAQTASEPRTKLDVALAEIARALTAGLCFGCVLPDAGYGLMRSASTQSVAVQRACHVPGVDHDQRQRRTTHLLAG